MEVICSTSESTSFRALPKPALLTSRVMSGADLRKSSMRDRSFESARSAGMASTLRLSWRESHRNRGQLVGATGDHYEIIALRGEPIGIDNANAGRCAGDQSSCLGGCQLRYSLFKAADHQEALSCTVCPLPTEQIACSTQQMLILTGLHRKSDPMRNARAIAPRYRQNE